MIRYIRSLNFIILCSPKSSATCFHFVSSFKKIQMFFKAEYLLGVLHNNAFPKKTNRLIIFIFFGKTKGRWRMAFVPPFA